ncbi:MAG: hypothetical protein H7644_06910 [Candidatus Heimdallarchaeota archaeon]|nr:hypothetical protein [Candidatus Heimdallarchaeota archaeon]MCK5143479.1 hypothetical protein [Candidatus Heimdallarchaeota archaeon]
MKVRKLFIGISLAALMIFTMQLASSNQALSNGNGYFFSSADGDLEQIHERYQLNNRLGDCESDCDCDGDGECNCDCENLWDQIQDRIKDKLQDGSCQD